MGSGKNPSRSATLAIAVISSVVDAGFFCMFHCTMQSREMQLVIAFTDTELSVLKVEFFLCIVERQCSDPHAFGPLLENLNSYCFVTSF